MRFLVDEKHDARVLIVATCRDSAVKAGQPLGEVVGALAYHALVQRLELHGLSAAEIRLLIEALGRTASAPFVTRIHRQSGGNPFFATELARAPDGAGIPEGVREAIGNHLRQLSEGCNRLLGIAAVIGPDFGLGTLEHVAAEIGDCAPVLQLLNEAQDAHIVVGASPAAGGYRFTHALIREGLYTGRDPGGLGPRRARDRLLGAERGHRDRQRVPYPRAGSVLDRELHDQRSARGSHTATKRHVAAFFTVHYGLFHAVYLAFLVHRADSGLAELIGLSFWVCVVSFALNHYWSYRYNRDLDRQGTPNIGTPMFTPYARIIPMHVVIGSGAALSPSSWGMLAFVGLMTLADAIMHAVEHAQLKKVRAAPQP